MEVPALAAAMIQLTPSEAGSPAAPSSTMANWTAFDASLLYHVLIAELTLVGTGEVAEKTPAAKTERLGYRSSRTASQRVPATQLQVAREAEVARERRVGGRPRADQNSSRLGQSTALTEVRGHTCPAISLRRAGEKWLTFQSHEPQGWL